eukprot:m.123341 g.123341  ORF g.123341 m.123341 type:complete len:103 (+) comp9645_c0_seq5:204-512(+)
MLSEDNKADAEAAATEDVHSSVTRSPPPLQAPAAKRQRSLSKDASRQLRAWLEAHEDDPYPSEAQKLELSAKLHITLTQINNWFVNARRRYLGGGSKVCDGG